MKSQNCAAALIVGIAILIAGCGTGDTAAETAKKSPSQWQATLVLKTDKNFQTPESVGVEAATGTAFVSNMVAAKEGKNPYWAYDGTGFISRLAPGGKVEKLQWVKSADKARLNSPKGITVLDGILYCADMNQVVRYSLKTGRWMEPIVVKGSVNLNDTANDGKWVYASDTATGKVHRLGGAKPHVIKGPAGVNGITFGGGRMYAVSWSDHDVYELDQTGRNEAKPFGLAGHFSNLDGIEVLGDGSIIVSDFTGNKISWISANHKKVRTLAEVKTPADIGMDYKRKLLYAPSLKGNFVAVYKLKK